MAAARQPGRAILGAAAIGAAVAALATRRVARRKGISPAAVLVSLAAGWIAPRLDGEGDLEREIARDRARGPALPPARLRRTMRFTDGCIGPTRAFRLDLPGRPPADPSVPTILYLHGGGYVLEVQAAQWGLITGLQKRLPARVVAPMYPLAPEHCWEAGLDAVAAVFDALAAEFGAGTIAIVGDSAGGGLALALAHRLRDAGRALPAALVLISPWLDVGATGTDQPALERRDPALSIAFLRKAGRLWAGTAPTDDPRVSPLFADQAGLPPTIMFSGGRDVLSSDAFRLASAAPGIEHRHYPEMIHVWPAAPIPEGRRALDEAAAFLRRHLPPG